MDAKKVGRAAPRWAALTLLAVAVFPSSTALSQTSARAPVVSSPSTVSTPSTASAPNTAPAPHAAASHTAPAARALVDQYCVVCHNQKALTAGVSLEGIDFSDAAANASIMERVLRKVRTGEMPPAGMPRPPAAALAAFTKTLEGALDQSAAA